MDHKIELSAYGLKIRPVRIEDAEFILRLRLDPAINRFVGDTSAGAGTQRDWIRDYLQRSGDYYFIIELAHSGQAVGTIGIYQEQTLEGVRTAEWGRWLITPGVMAALASAYLVYQAAFEVLGLDQVTCRTAVENLRVLAFHDQSGAERVRVLPADVTIQGKPLDQVLFRVTRTQWGTLSSKLASYSARSEKFLA